jgi:hypothetical protein
MLKLDPEIEEKLEKFANEAEIKFNRRLFPAIEGVVRQDNIYVKFRDLYLDGLATVLFRKGVGWLSCFLSLRGGVGMIACMILVISRHLGRVPKTIYLDRHVSTGEADVTVEWYALEIDDSWRREVHNMLGFKIEKKIKFEDVLDEARKFLREMIK